MANVKWFIFGFIFGSCNSSVLLCTHGEALCLVIGCCPSFLAQIFACKHKTGTFFTDLYETWSEWICFDDDLSVKLKSGSFKNLMNTQEARDLHETWSECLDF